MPCRIFCCHFWVGACLLKPQKWASGQHRLWNCQSKNYLPCNQRLQKMKIRPLEDGWRFAVFCFLTFRILVLYGSLIAFIAVIASTQVQKGRLGQVGLQSGNATMLETIGWLIWYFFTSKVFFGNRMHYILIIGNLWTFRTFDCRKRHLPKKSSTTWFLKSPASCGRQYEPYFPSQISFPKVPFCKKWLSSILSNKFSTDLNKNHHFPRRFFSYQWNLCFKLHGPRCSYMVQVLKFRNRKLRLPRLPCWASLIPLKSKLLRYASKQWNVEGSSGSSWRWWKKQRRWLMWWMWWMWRWWWGWDWGDNGRLKDWSDAEGAFFLRQVTVFSARSQRCGKFMQISFDSILSRPVFFSSGTVHQMLSFLSNTNKAIENASVFTSFPVR